MHLDNLKKIQDFIYEIPRGYKKGMLVPARIYASQRLIENMDDAVFEQISNVAMLPGIQKYALCLPDGHSGYGFPIGGVAAIDPDRGVISPGGIGFDINCGIRMVATALTLEEVKPKLKDLVNALFGRVPSGVGAKGMLRLSKDKLDEAMVKGARWGVDNGFGMKEDLEYIEESGAIEGADPRSVSEKARERGKNQIGTLGSGNHFLEIQVARKDNIFDEDTARRFGIFLEDQVFIMIHCGSRGFGHQVATDYLYRFISVMQEKYGLTMPDRELACSPFYSDDGRAYFEAMNCAINIAFLNRQLIMHRVREVFSDIFKKSPEQLGIIPVYDVCHNTAKLETHTIDGREKRLLIHRKGATRAFAAGMSGIPDKYRDVGQPVIIGGSMESGSYLLAGASTGVDAFYTTAHGSGRAMSRKQARKRFYGRDLQKKLEESGIFIRTASLPGLAEEAGAAYKDIDEVVDATSKAGLSRAVARLEPIGNIKG
jgi:tRNA-splicing ligase RtcB